MDESTLQPSAPTGSLPSFASPPPQRDVRWVFLGPNGLRAGWAILIFVGVFLGLSWGSGLALRHFWHPHIPPGPMPPIMGVVGEGSGLAILALVVFIMSILERKPFLSYGYQGEGRAVRFVSGLAWGFAAISLLVLALWKLGYLALDGRSLSGSSILSYAAEWGLVFLVVGFFEESIMRGYVQFTLTRGIGFWWGAILMSCLFGFGHHTNTGESPVGLFSAGAIGLVFCLSLWYTGSLWWAVGFHAAWDWGESYFYGTADSGLIVKGHLYGEHPIGKLLMSGGATGPEGSLLVVPLLLIIVAAMVLWWGPRVRSPFAGGAFRPLKAKAATEIRVPQV
ncbi:MAG TPA: CPBP family intramembrane glutamic endopeptidase [Acidobacteriaceae bacterium]|nr:CPBP family intramembrane glutamic endopeptidase [Acidobacteriaceae bacterium]